jgi:hypothetical protein
MLNRRRIGYGSSALPSKTGESGGPSQPKAGKGPGKPPGPQAPMASPLPMSGDPMSKGIDGTLNPLNAAPYMQSGDQQMGQGMAGDELGSILDMLAPGLMEMMAHQSSVQAGQPAPQLRKREIPQVTTSETYRKL